MPSIKICKYTDISESELINAQGLPGAGGVVGLVEHGTMNHRNFRAGGPTFAQRRRLLAESKRDAPNSLAFMAAGGMFGSRVAQVRTSDSPAAVPVVDKLAVRVVTDSYHHAFEPGRTVGGVQVQRLGFAMSPRTPPQRTLQNFKPDVLIPMHSSGESFISMVQQAMPDRFVRSSTGTRFTFFA